MLKAHTLFSSILFAVILIFADVSFGQATSGTIEGTVVDSAGTSIAGAEVSAESINRTAGFKRSVTCDQAGYFVFAELPPGVYKISVTATNFSGFWDEISVSAGQTSSLKPVLKVGKQTDPPYVIVSSYPDIMPRKTTFSSALKFSPFVRPEPLAAGFQIDGASGSENTFFIDGQEVTNYRTGLLNSNNDLPFELLSEVKVIAGMRESRFGGALGGVVNVTTQGGNDQWHGNLGVSFVPASLQGKPNVVLNRYGTSFGQTENFRPNKDEGTAFFPTASVSGPILKNKLWFFSSYSPQIYDVTRSIDYFTTTNPATRTVSQTIEYQSNVRAEEAFLRLDSQPISNLRLFGTFLYNPIIQDGGLPQSTEGLSGFPQSLGGLSGAALLAERGGRQNSNIVNGQAAWDVADNVVLTFRAGRGFLNEKLNSYGIPRVTRFICAAGFAASTTPGSNCSSGFQNTSNNSVVDYDASTRTTFDADAAIFGINFLGRHNFRVGYQLNHLLNEAKEGYTDTGIVNLFYGRSISTLTGQNSTPGNLGSGFLQRFGTTGEAGSRNQAIFGQNSWRIAERLTLDLGVRFENEVVPNYGSTDTQTVEFGWNDKIAPRLGFALDVMGDGKIRVFGGYGRYYDRFKYQLPRNLFGGTLFRRDYFEILPSRGAAYSNYTFNAILGGRADVAGGTCPIVGGPGFSICQFDFSVPTNLTVGDVFTTGAVDPAIKAARQSEFTVGVDSDLFWGLTAAGRFTHKEIDRAIEAVGVVNSQGSQAFVIANPGFGRICEIAASANIPCPKAERRYDAIEVAVEKRAANYFFNANYTWSRLFGNYSGLASSDEFGFASPNLTNYFNLPSQGFTANGDSDSDLLPTDRPHVFKAFGEYSFVWNGRSNRTSVSAFTTIQSGTPLTTIYNLFGITTSILFGRGDLGRTETFSETDLRVGHQYSFGSDKKFLIEPFVVLLNLFDERNVLSRQTSISATNFTSSTLIQGGCTSCQSQFAVYNTIFNGSGIQQPVMLYLLNRGTSATGTRNDYNLPTSFQDRRNVRFGFRFRF